MTYRMVIDVESVGLHGEAFAVGYVVTDDTGKRVAEDLIACNPKIARGTASDFEWVKRHVPDMAFTAGAPQHVMERFWIVWLDWKERGAEMWADCAWPVEARFLAACVEDGHPARDYQGPYPLHEIATLLLARGLDPLATFQRLPDELPAHNPLADARQSARILHMLLTGREKEIA